MSTAISRLHTADFEEALDVLNLAFGKAPPRDFEAILPALYRRGEEEMSWNFGLRENGRIRAIVGLFPLAYRWGGETLRVAGIGGVSCHPHARGRGYMQQLMAHCVEIAPVEGFHLSWLGGQRQRYGYFGYEKCGVYYRLTLSQTNVRHAFGDADFGIDFFPLECEDRTHLQGVIGLHDAQPFRGVRAPHRFYNLLLSWGHRPYVARSRDGRMIGYLVAQADRTGVTELLAVNEGEPELEIAAAWVQRYGNTSFELPPWSRLLPKLAQLSEGVSASSSGNWQIFDWAATLDALLKTRAALGAPDGRRGRRGDCGLRSGCAGGAGRRLAVRSHRGCSRPTNGHFYGHAPALRPSVAFARIAPACCGSPPRTVVSAAAFLGSPRRSLRSQYPFGEQR